MARKATLTLKGFDEFAERLAEVGGSIERTGKYAFYKAALNVRNELIDKAQSAGLDHDLIAAIEERHEADPRTGRFTYEVGWRKPRTIVVFNKQIPDAYKVIFFNYGTPRRQTKSGANRGKEDAHPKGSKGFIKKAKLAAVAKNKALYRSILSDVAKALEGKR